MEKWFEILFDNRIAFKPFFDIEIENHRRIRERAERKGIKHLILIVNFDKIAKIIDHHFISIRSSKLNIITINGAIIPPLAKIDAVLVEALLNVSYTDLGNVPQLIEWIHLITTTENQTLTERLANLNVLANSLNEAMKITGHALVKAYLNGLYSQLLLWIHETLGLVDWLCHSDYEKLPKPLLKEFKTCKHLHMSQSKQFI
jgi:hypothetical protein